MTNRYQPKQYENNKPEELTPSLGVSEKRSDDLKGGSDGEAETPVATQVSPMPDASDAAPF